MNTVEKISQEQAKQDRHPDFVIGDTVKVHYKIKEGGKERIQVYSGTVIARKGGGVMESITVRRVMERFLERTGIRVMTAKDGLDAIRVLQDAKPDIILLDIEMPNMDGYEFATHVRNDERVSAVPIIMITSRAGDKHRARAIEIGVNGYLGKPYQESQLLDSIRRLLEEQGITLQ